MKQLVEKIKADHNISDPESSSEEEDQIDSAPSRSCCARHTQPRLQPGPPPQQSRVMAESTPRERRQDSELSSGQVVGLAVGGLIGGLLGGMRGAVVGGTLAAAFLTPTDSREAGNRPRGGSDDSRQSRRRYT